MPIIAVMVRRPGAHTHPVNSTVNTVKLREEPNTRAGQRQQRGPVGYRRPRRDRSIWTPVVACVSSASRAAW